MIGLILSLTVYLLGVVIWTTVAAKSGVTGLELEGYYQQAWIWPFFASLGAVVGVVYLLVSPFNYLQKLVIRLGKS